MRKRRIAKHSILTALRKLLIQPDTKIQSRKHTGLNGSCNFNIDEDENGVRRATNIVITVDKRRDSVVSVVIHELLHIYLCRDFKIDFYFTSELEESIIKGLERDLYNFLMLPHNETLLESWYKAIERKFV